MSSSLSQTRNSLIFVVVSEKLDTAKNAANREINGEERAYHSAVDPSDAEDFDVTTEAMDGKERALLIRKMRTALGLSQMGFAGQFRVSVEMLRDWEQGRATHWISQSLMCVSSGRTRI